MWTPSAVFESWSPALWSQLPLEMSRCSHHQNRVITNPAPYIRSFWGWGGSPRGCACDCSTCRRGCRFPASTFAMGWRLGWEVPPDTGSVFRYACQVPSASGGTKSQATAVAERNSGWRSGMRHPVPWAKLAEQDLISK